MDPKLLRIIAATIDPAAEKRLMQMDRSFANAQRTYDQFHRQTVSPNATLQHLHTGQKMLSVHTDAKLNRKKIIQLNMQLMGSIGNKESGNTFMENMTRDVTAIDVFSQNVVNAAQKHGLTFLPTDIAFVEVGANTHVILKSMYGAKTLGFLITYAEKNKIDFIVEARMTRFSDITYNRNYNTGVELANNTPV